MYLRLILDSLVHPEPEKYVLTRKYRLPLTVLLQSYTGIQLIRVLLRSKIKPIGEMNHRTRRFWQHLTLDYSAHCLYQPCS